MDNFTKNYVAKLLNQDNTFSVYTYFRSLQTDVLNVCPGDMFDIMFPDNFEIESHNGEFSRFKGKAKLNHICVYFWDEDDHYKCDFYLHFDGSENWNAKYDDLTEESAKKIYKYICETHNN